MLIYHIDYSYKVPKGAVSSVSYLWMKYVSYLQILAELYMPMCVTPCVDNCSLQTDSYPKLTITMTLQ